MNRFRAALIHLGLSLIAMLIVLYLIFMHWYPGNTFAIEGGLKGLAMVSLIDIVIGPGLTYYS